jgi:adenosylcobinamide kinase/adenosylcobinamide-phosphate guanylyltransferase
MIFITGGARSGKSALAESVAARRGGEVVYIATAGAGDDEMRGRIEEHRRRRPADWQTVEAPDDLPAAVTAGLADGRTVLVDCLTMYLSNLILSQEAVDSGELMRVVDGEIGRLADICRSGNGDIIMVSNEVGMGIVPENPLARIFRDAAGRANQRLAQVAEEVFMCVSGIPLKVK